MGRLQEFCERLETVGLAGETGGQRPDIDERTAIALTLGWWLLRALLGTSTGRNRKADKAGMMVQVLYLDRRPFWIAREPKAETAAILFLLARPMLKR